MGFDRQEALSRGVSMMGRAGFRGRGGGMAMEMDARVEGYEDALRSVRALANGKARINIIRGGIRAAGAVIAGIAEREAPRGGRGRVVPGYGYIGPGALKSTVRVSTRIVRGAGNLALAVGVDSVEGKVKAGKRAKGIFWAHLVEGGTRPHSLVPRGKRSVTVFFGGRPHTFVRGQKEPHHRGAAANAFMERAGRMGGAAAGRAFSEYVERRIARLAATGQVQS